MWKDYIKYFKAIRPIVYLKFIKASESKQANLFFHIL